MDKRSIFGLEPDQLDELLSEITGDLDESDPDAAASPSPHHVEGPKKPRVAGPTASLQGSLEQFGGQIGSYKLLSVLGEGGMGMVYLAEQEQPIKRRVALKIIKPGMDSKQIIARFEAERQALALLDHPNIAHVFEAGTMDAGRPYFVMEYAKGLPITEYCDQHKLVVEDRLRLFVNVCQGLQHAHQKGIIHRDIKPSNILVTTRNNQTIPKIIDFGIAKAVSQPLTERTLYTEQGQLVGTPEYMSPEQADLANEDIDTRSDVYSLGVLLYTLLAGVLPFDPKTFREGGIENVRHTIREVEPKTPSAQLTSLGDAANELAQRRRTEVGTLAKRLHDELEWIPLKAMRKERAERYRSASEFADDIENYLRGDPLIAGPPSTVYRLRKFLRRHKALVTGLAAVLAVLTAGIVVSTLFAIGQSRARFDAQQALKALTKLESDVEIDRNLSTAQKLHAEGRYRAALAEIETILDHNDIEPKAHLLRATLLCETGDFNDAFFELEKLLDQAPEIAGTAHYLIAEMYMGNDPNLADEHRRLAESLLPQTAEAFCLRAMTASIPEEKIQWLSNAIRLDPGHYPSRKARALVYYTLGDYQRMERDVEAIIVLRPKDPFGYAFRSVARREMGQFEEAVRDLDHAIQICNDESEMAELYDQRWRIHYEKGDYAKALSDTRQCVQLRPEEIRYRFHLFATLVVLDHYAEADLEYARIIDLGPEVKKQFDNWTAKHVFNMLAMNRPLPLAGDVAGHAALWRMREAADYYRRLDTKADRFVPAGITQSWSPDGTKLAYSRRSEILRWQPAHRKVTTVASVLPQLRGLESLDPSSNGIEILDMQEGTIRLLVSFGHSPRWSPDGKYVAFTRSSVSREQSGDEVWLIPATGGNAKHLVKGWAIAWTSDAKGLYYHCRDDNYIYRIFLDGPDVEPEQIAFCRNPYPAISPNGKYLAQVDMGTFRIIELSSEMLVTQWQMPFTHADNVVVEWSPNGRELSIGELRREDLGLWIYDMAMQTASKILDGHVARAIWSPNGTRIAFEVREPYCEIWIADLKPGLPTIEALGPGQTPDEHYQFLSSQYIRTCQYLHAAEADVLANELETVSFIAGLSSLGITEYREGMYQKALEKLSTVDTLRHAVGSEVFATEVAFLAMTLYQLGHYQEAESAFERFQRILETGLGVAADFILAKATNLGPPINGPDDTQETCITYDGLELYLSCNRSGGYGGHDIWLAKRATLRDHWDTPVNLGPTINSPKGEIEPAISPDGLELYFRRGEDLWVAKRTTRHGPWGYAETLRSPVNSPSHFDLTPDISADGLSLYFSSTRPDGWTILWVSTRATKNAPWGQPVNLGPPVNTPHGEACPCITADGLTLYFCSVRPGGCGVHDIWVSTRSTNEDAWGEPVNLGPTVNSPHWDYGPTISADGMTLYFDSSQAGGTRVGSFGGQDIWQVSRVPLVDVNGNGELDVQDLCILAEDKPASIK